MNDIKKIEWMLNSIRHSLDELEMEIRKEPVSRFVVNKSLNCWWTEHGHNAPTGLIIDCVNMEQEIRVRSALDILIKEGKVEMLPLQMHDSRRHQIRVHAKPSDVSDLGPLYLIGKGKGCNCDKATDDKELSKPREDGPQV